MRQWLWLLLYRLGRLIARKAWAALQTRIETRYKELTMPRTIGELQAAVGEWSAGNFGEQESKTHRGLVLGSINPLMGIGEEIGELAEGKTAADLRDAISDVVIYLCDYCYREAVRLDQIIGQDAPYEQEHNGGDLLSGVVAAYGKLLRATLKHHQGIRGMEDPVAYAIARRDAVSRLYLALSNYAWWVLDLPLIVVVNETWDAVVAKRDWKKDAEHGGNHTHENADFPNTMPTMDEPE